MLFNQYLSFGAQDIVSVDAYIFDACDVLKAFHLALVWARESAGQTVMETMKHVLVDSKIEKRFIDYVHKEGFNLAACRNAVTSIVLCDSFGLESLLQTRC